MHARFYCALAIIPLIAGCGEPSNPAEPLGRATHDVAATTPQAIQTFDDVMADIARSEVPGFGGYYLSDGYLVVQLTDTLQAQTAFAYLKEHRDELQLPDVPMRAHRVKYDFVALKSWFDQTVGHARGNGIHQLSVDEVNNRLTLGVEAPVDESRAVGLARFMGVPDDGFFTKHVSRIAPRSSLDAVFRPLRGGVQIQSPAGTCSLGFIVKYTPVPRAVTASHCTTARFGFDGDPIGQPVNNSSYNIGNEVADVGCTFYPGCRYSDAAIVAFAPDVTYELGRLVKTTGASFGAPGSGVIDDASPYFDITAKWGSSTAAPVGTVLHKIGRTTGWTYGYVTSTCVWHDGVACNWVTNIYSDSGDSGSPVFQQNGYGATASLHGLLWGGPTDNLNESWHNPLYYIEHDFGVSFKVCLPTYGC